MKKLFFAFLILAAAACGRGYEEHITVADMALPPPAQEAVADNSMEGAAPAAVERKIIREGEIAFETSDPAKTRQAITDAVTSAGGYVTSDNIYDYGEGMRHHMEVRVPAERFDGLLAAITASAGRLESKHIHSRDVTEEFIDVAARVKTKKELEERYKELLKRASSVKEVLEVERELGKLRSEIESVEGRLNYLTDQVAMSTLAIDFYEHGESNFGFGLKFSGALKAGWKNLLSFLIGLIHIWPFLLLIGGGVWGLCRWRLKRKARRQNT